MLETAVELPLRSRLLPLLHEAQERDGFLSGASVTAIAAQVRIPIAEAWEAATSYPDFHFDSHPAGTPVCDGFSCRIRGARVGPGERPVGCRFRCYDAPAPGLEGPFPEEMLRLAGPLLAPEDGDLAGLERAVAVGQAGAVDELLASGLRGRGGAYFPAGQKWRAALDEGRPLALVINAEEGEPGVFKDRAIFCRRPQRFLEGLAIAMVTLRPDVTVIFINGEAHAAREALEAGLDAAMYLPSRPHIVPGGGGYVLGEESALLNAIEGRKPVPRLRPPYPVERGLWGMPTVINNVETIASLPLVFREGASAFRTHGTSEAPGTKLLSISGRVERPGIYEVELGTPLGKALALASPEPNEIAVIAGGPSGGLLPASELDRPLLPGLMHPTGAVTGSGGMVVLDATADLRAAVLAMAAFNAEESCGKCTPCRDGAPRALQLVEAGDNRNLPDLLDALQFASICGLGQMAPGPIRSARHFWPDLFP